MVGEMRDTETANVAVSAALSGQLVMTTLHSNDAVRTIDRLLELGVERHSIASALTGIVAQRLVRLLCRHCRAKTVISPAEALDFGMDRSALSMYRADASVAKGQATAGAQASSNSFSLTTQFGMRWQVAGQVWRLRRALVSPAINACISMA